MFLLSTPFDTLGCVHSYTRRFLDHFNIPSMYDGLLCCTREWPLCWTHVFSGCRLMLFEICYRTCESNNNFLNKSRRQCERRKNKHATGEFHIDCELLLFKCWRQAYESYIVARVRYFLHFEMNTFFFSISIFRTFARWIYEPISESRRHSQGNGPLETMAEPEP